MSGLPELCASLNRTLQNVHLAMFLPSLALVLPEAQEGYFGQARAAAQILSKKSRLKQFC
jgi:hypothetical protein